MVALSLVTICVEIVSSTTVSSVTVAWTNLDLMVSVLMTSAVMEVHAPLPPMWIAGKCRSVALREGD